MSAVSRSEHDRIATAYEQHLRERWETLSPYEQAEARAYMQAKFTRSMVPVVVNEPPGWTVPVGYVSAIVALVFIPIVFGPLAFGLGIYNVSKGRNGHGIAQIILSIVCTLIGMILGVLVWMA
jgi:hypothetical protein